MSISKLDRKNILFFIGKNCSTIQSLLVEISKTTNFKIKNGIMGLNKNLNHTLDENLEFLLDTFCDYFLDKGIVSVEYTDTPGRPNIPSVPFIKEPIKNREYTLVIGKKKTFCLEETLNILLNKTLNKRLGRNVGALPTIRRKGADSTTHSKIPGRVRKVLRVGHLHCCATGICRLDSRQIRHQENHFPQTVQTAHNAAQQHQHQRFVENRSGDESNDYH